MDPVNNYNTTNEMPQPLSDAYLKEKYHIPEGKEFSGTLLLVRSIEDTHRAARELVQSGKGITNSIRELGESSKELHEQVKNSEKETIQSLQDLTNSSSEMKAITSNIAKFAKRFFNPIKNGVRNGFYLLTGRREPLAIEDNSENTISDTDPTNQTSGDKKKNFVSLLMFFVLSGGLYFAHAGEQKNL